MHPAPGPAENARAERRYRLRKVKLGMVKSVIVDEVDNMLEDVYAGELTALLESTPLFLRRDRTTEGQLEDALSPEFIGKCAVK